MDEICDRQLTKKKFKRSINIQKDIQLLSNQTNHTKTQSKTKHVSPLKLAGTGICLML